MAKIRRRLVTHTFRGRRFEDHGVDVDVLPDLVAYKNLLVETAKELWRRHHPERQRLPGKFEESLQLKFFEVQEGSAAIPLVREIDYDGVPPHPELLTDELDEAVELVARTIGAAAEHQLLPPELPKSVLAHFDDYGKTLKPDESFEILPDTWRNPVRYTGATRELLTTWADAPYEDSIDLVGTVTMARVSRPRLALQLPDGSEIETAFAWEHEDTVLAALTQHATAKVRLRGRGQFSASGRLARIISVERITFLPEGDIPYDYAAKPIWEEIDELIANIPPEELERLPTDGAEQHDHYIYGTPRRPR